MTSSSVHKPLEWSVMEQSDLSVAAFSIPGGVLELEDLQHVKLPPELHGREQFGLIFSGRGPIWLYACLLHLAHPFAWIAIHDPRLGGAVVVQRHTSKAPGIGSLLPMPDEDSQP